MKQVLLRKGTVLVEDVPAPAKDPHSILVEVSKSLISPGTEMATIDQSGASMIRKALDRPSQALNVIDSIKIHGIKKTFVRIQDALDRFQLLGYSCVGTVLAVGRLVKNIQTGDRVACAGSGYANHAEIVSVPANLAVKIPADLSDVDAAFATLGAIALQGVRRADVRLGEVVYVMGLGLLGQLTAQLLKAAGCLVVASDPDKERVRIAIELGLAYGFDNTTEAQKKISVLTGSHGCDVTIITASTASSDPVNQAFELTRKKGRIVVVGAVGMALQRSPFYEKEQDFLISCSYGPGRYDPVYEGQGVDYPYAYVRWTENRNLAAFLSLLKDKKINVSTLVDKEFPVAEAPKAYDYLNTGASKPLGVLIHFETAEKKMPQPALKVDVPMQPQGNGQIRMGIIGFGEIMKSTHLPNLRSLREKIVITGLCTSNAAEAARLARRMKLATVVSEPEELIKRSDIDAVFIATRHDRHASIAAEALKAGKHVFLEKPLALTDSELNSLDMLIRTLPVCPVFMVGFNRRYAPTIKVIQDLLQNRTEPLIATYRVNAGAISPGHWVNTEEGGGRIRGEACHMIDVFKALVKAPLVELTVNALHPTGNSSHRPDENFSVQLSYQDGSVCHLIYTSSGHSQLPKEYLEVHWEGKSCVLDDFARLTVYSKQIKQYSWRQDKGHFQIVSAFAACISGGLSFPIPWEHLKETTAATIEMDKSVWGNVASL